MRFLTRIKGITRKCEIENSTVTKQLNMKPVLTNIKKISWDGLNTYIECRIR